LLPKKKDEKDKKDPDPIIYCLEEIAEMPFDPEV
jgi:hypothetical protein